MTRRSAFERSFGRCLAIAALLCLAGCDMLGIESATAVAAKREAEGKAIGGACRFSARPIEQCFAMNKRADKAAMFAGWREMNDYMRDNKIEAMPAAPEASAPEGQASGEAASDSADAVAAAAGDKHGGAGKADGSADGGAVKREPAGKTAKSAGEVAPKSH